MADVGTRGAAGSDRGQLILVTGLLIAVTMVALVLLLNTAIYTENLASRGADQSGREAMEYRGTVVDGVDGLIDAENDREHGDPAAVEANVTAGIDRIDNLTARSYAIGETVVLINQSSLGIHNGTLIRQIESGELVNDSGQSNWTVATDLSYESDHVGTRSFTLSVDRVNLTETNVSRIDENGAFYVRLDDGASQWRVYVYQNESDVTIATESGGTVEEVCSTNTDEVTVDLTKGIINGKACSEYEWAEGISSDYVIEIGNGDEAFGKYELTVNSTESSQFPGLNDGPSNSPYYVPAVYSATFDVYYESPTLTYRTEVRVAPGESE